MSDTSSDAAEPVDNNSPRSSGLAAGIMGGLSVYIGIFVILFLDDMVWKTRYLDRWIPDACHVPLRILFYPLLLICNWLGLLPGGMPSIL